VNDQIIKLELPLSVITVILTGLGELPLKQANAAFRAIESQLQAALSPPVEPEAA
jgi:hypothetical protein